MFGPYSRPLISSPSCKIWTTINPLFCSILLSLDLHGLFRVPSVGNGNRTACLNSKKKGSIVISRKD